MKIILRLVFFLVASSAWAFHGSSGHATIDIPALMQKIAQFETQNGRPPKIEEGFHVLIAKPEGKEFENWQQLLKIVPLDPWNHHYIYVERPLPDGTMGYGVYSTGPDGTSETDGNDSDDLNSWTRKASLAPSESARIASQTTLVGVVIVFFALLVVLWRGSVAQAKDATFGKK